VYSVAAIIRNCHDNFVWRLITVYGSPYDEGKQEFINELENLLDNWDGPTMIGGDFNLVCNVKIKVMESLTTNGQICSWTRLTSLV